VLLLFFSDCRIYLFSSLAARVFNKFTRYSLLSLLVRVPCSKAVKTRNLLKFAVVQQTRHRISADSRPKFTVLSGHVGEILLFNNFFRLSMRALVEDIARQSCAMVRRWRLFGDFLGPVFSASRAQHISDLHSKFALRPHHVSKNGRHPICDR